MKKEVRELIDQIVNTIPEIDTPEGKAKQDELFSRATALTNTPEEKKEAGQYLLKTIKERRRGIRRPDVDVKGIINEMSSALSMAYIAKQYFGKDRSWLYQRINNTEVNGKPASFTQDELKILADSLGDLGNRLSALSIAIRKSLSLA